MWLAWFVHQQKKCMIIEMCRNPEYDSVWDAETTSMAETGPVELSAHEVRDFWTPKSLKLKVRG